MEGGGCSLINACFSRDASCLVTRLLGRICIRNAKKADLEKLIGALITNMVGGQRCRL